MFDTEYFEVGIVGAIAYTETLNRSDTAYGKQRNNFESTLKLCIDFIDKSDVKVVYGSLKDKYAAGVIKKEKKDE